MDRRMDEKMDFQVGISALGPSPEVTHAVGIRKEFVLL